MTSKQKNQLFIVIATLLAVFCIYQLTKILGNGNLEKVIVALENANYFWLIVSVGLAVFSYWLRAKRQKLLLEPMGYNIKTSSGFWTIAFAYFMNMVIPRSGEIARASSLYQLEKVPIEKSLGTIVLERIIDLIFLALFFALTLIFCPKPFYEFLKLAEGNNSSEGIALWQIIVLIVGVTSTVLLFIFWKKIKQTHVFKKLRQALIGFKEGLLSILKIKQKFLFTVYSFAIWICYFLMTYLVIFSFEETQNLSFNYGFFLMISGSLGMILPATGGLAYPLVMSKAFGAISLSLGGTFIDGEVIGSYFGLSLYFAQLLGVLLFGFASLYYISRNKIST